MAPGNCRRRLPVLTPFHSLPASILTPLLPTLPPGRVFLHPSSLNFRCGRFESGWLVFSELVQTSKVFVRESSMVPVYAILLFGGEGWIHMCA